MLVLGSTALVGEGCVTEGPPERRPIRVMKEQPEGLVVDRVVPAIDKLADDTDRNGYYDTFRVAVFLFASGYAQSIQGEGSLECVISDPATGKELAKWTLGPAEMEAAWGMSGVMPGYNFLLNLNDGGTDRSDSREALFSCAFRPTSGPPVPALSRLVVMVGPLR
jgi:hypothetical protein